MEYAFLVITLGLAVVMLVLLLLYLFFHLLGRFISRFKREVVISPPAQAADLPAPVEISGVKPVLVAAAAAAVYSYLEKTPGQSFPIIPAAQPDEAAVWRLEGRRLQMGGRRQIDLLRSRRQRKGEKV